MTPAALSHIVRACTEEEGAGKKGQGGPRTPISRSAFYSAVMDNNK